MPALAIPPELKKITPYIRRAEELDKAATAANASPESRLVAYYLRQYAVQQGIPLAATSSAAKTCLGHILAALETEKAAMDNFTKEEAGFLCRQFAQKIFDKADLEDRDGAATKETARTFYAAATFWQILEQFTSGSDQGDEEAAEVATEDRKRIVYAKWKATEILKALKEGRTPTPGGYGQDDGLLPMDEDDDDGNNKGGASNPDETVPNVTPVQDSDADEEILMPPPPAPSPPAVPSPAASPPPIMPPPPPSPEEGTEVGLDGAVDTNSTTSDEPPPPAYPGPAAATGRSRPPVNFDLPPAVPPPPPQPPVKPVVPPPAAAAPKPQPPAKPSTGWFGRGNNNNNNNAGGKLTKAQWADAMELTRFALAALEDKNADVAAQRLQQALQTLGR
eukprot:scaffold289_cov147-Amphora_coffeaeformis.AAC.12